MITDHDALNDALSHVFFSFRDRINLIGNYGEFVDMVLKKGMTGDFLDRLNRNGFTICTLCVECGQPNGEHYADCMGVN